MRTGKALIQATKPFAEEDRAKSWRLLLGTLAVQAGFWAVILGTTWLPGRVLASLASGMISVRLFIFYHDYCHGAIFRGSRAGKAVMTLVGWWTMTVPSVWIETHNYHHRNNAKLVGSAIGSYPTVSLGMYRGIDASRRRQLKIIRSPWSIAAGLLTTFVVGMCILPWRRKPEQHRMAPVVGIVWWSALAMSIGVLGFTTSALLILLPAIVWSAVGSYMFYAQHNFPDAQLMERRAWDYTDAALKCSSYFEMPGWMHWLTGNIGYHHVHHLNHNIPFYRLPEAMAALPELQSPGRTSWAPRDILACLRCSVWDGEQGRFISFDEADAAVAASQAVAAK